MGTIPAIGFGAAEIPSKGTLVVFAATGFELGKAARQVDEASGGILTAAAEAQSFKGNRFTTLALPLPRGLEVTSVVMVGLG